MSLKKIAIALVAASVAFTTAAPAFAGPGPKDFQNKPDPKFPGPGPKDFKLPPKKVGPKKPHHNHDAAFGAMMGLGVLTAVAIAAAAADDEPECWHEKRKGHLVQVCAVD